MPNLFGHAERKGCSVQRELAGNEEVAEFVRRFLGVPGRKWLGVVSARASAIRALAVDGVAQQAVCVYDTAEPNNPAHAEFGWSGWAGPLDEGDAPELRKRLFDAFTGNAPIAPNAYRGGAIQAAIAP